MIEGLSALSGLGRTLGPAAPQTPTSPLDGVGFEEALGQAVGSAVDVLKTGEAAAIQGIEGAAPPMRVVESVMDAQRTLQSVLAVRDKLVSAWQDISRMSI
ncbi:flagellar hook-basal body complex protein FliE [Roseiarcus sp.]|uniref:flagellar hook-basal body complex protein FliE n=1 Tax=Roseiarcus sp. TaxID=1969460 RepID=UPI003F9E2A78